MAGRRVFFSFSYQQDIWKASNIRNSGEFDAFARAGWTDASLWEQVQRKGDSEIRRVIDAGLTGTSVTAVLIGEDTANRRWVNYEIQRTIELKHGLIGVHMNRVRNQDGKRSKKGQVPSALSDGGYRIYEWNPSTFVNCVERAAIESGKPCLAHNRKKCFMCRWMKWY